MYISCFHLVLALFSENVACGWVGTLYYTVYSVTLHVILSLKSRKNKVSPLHYKKTYPHAPDLPLCVCFRLFSNDEKEILIPITCTDKQNHHSVIYAVHSLCFNTLWPYFLQFSCSQTQRSEYFSWQEPLGGKIN